jgi:hypothetical protein
MQMNPNVVLNAYGLRATIENDLLVVRWKDGLECSYSGRLFTRVAFPGLGVHVEARLIQPGVGEIRIDGQVLTYDGCECQLPID